MKNDLGNALVDIDQSISADPYNPWAYRNKGIYFFKITDYTSAARLLERAEKMDPSIEKLYFYLGHTYSALGDQPKACKSFGISVQRKELEKLPKQCL
jgi:tetratricopeptide (TPR) repeat protein